MEHKNVTLSLSDNRDYIQIQGDIDELRRDRRMAISLKRIDPNYDQETLRIHVADRDVVDLLRLLHDALSKRGYREKDDDNSSAVLKEYYDEQRAFGEFSEKARRIRNNNCDERDFEQFTETLSVRLPGRQLYPLQLLSAYHLAFSQNAAIFPFLELVRQQSSLAHMLI